MADSFSKKEHSKKKAQKLNEKAQRREERKSNNNKGKSLEDMLVYVDQYGNLTDVHPDDQKEDQPAYIREAETGSSIDKEYTGVVSYYSDKGYGFITQDNSKDNLFVHSSDLSGTLSQGDKVSFKKQKTTKGLRALDVKII